MRIVYPGIEGTFAHEASTKLFPDKNAVPGGSFDDVAKEVADGEADAGVLPLRNSIAGAVPGIGSLVDQYGLTIVREIEVSVELCLMGLTCSDMSEITAVASHPMALRQCSRRLKILKLKLIETPSTADAAFSFLDEKTAALASPHAAKLFDRKILVANMTDEPDSRTTFAVLRRGMK